MICCWPHREDYDAARAGFRWPRPGRFNFATDWFEAVLAAEHPDRAALRIIEDDGSESSWTFAEMARRAEQVAGWLRAEGVRPGMRVLLLLGNQVELWECTLAAMKLGASSSRARRCWPTADLRDRVDRGDVGAVIAAVGADRSLRRRATAAICGSRSARPCHGWLRYSDSEQSLQPAVTDVATAADDPLLLYFTSGTTALPKLVEHTHVSYPIGHLSTMYWIGLRPGDVHLNVSSPGWAKHAWSCVFAPWLAGATICIFNYDALRRGRRCSTCCAMRSDHLLRAADGVADADPAGPGAVADRRCASWSGPVSRSIPR